MMSGVISAGVNCDESISDPDDDDDDEMMMETDREVDDMIEECISIVNEKEVVAFIVELVETSDDPAVIKQVCIITHHLLLHNNLAMYQYTLLYTLAFTPDFLRQLWCIITSLWLNLSH